VVEVVSELAGVGDDDAAGKDGDDRLIWVVARLDTGPNDSRPQLRLRTVGV
jgi:hypothetical protein